MRLYATLISEENRIYQGAGGIGQDSQCAIRGQMALKAFLPSISGKQAARYVFLPEILPRLRAFGGSGFGYLAFLIASVYQTVRILPPGHAYARPGNIGTFGLRDVITEAANHVKLEWRNVDQVIVYFAVIAAVIILALQFVALVILLFSGQALAGSNNAGDYSFFVTAAPEKDIAFLLLDHVFGIPDFFGSEAPTNTPFHQALHAMFHFYNFAILIIAALIFLYYIVVVVVETAQSGTPFGQRFNTVYAPLRLVIALGLLVPLNYGLNGSQYIALYAAKVGSSFATNGWLRFNDTLENPLGADNKTMLGTPVIPEVKPMVEHMALVHTCAAAYKKIQDYDIKVYLIADGKAHQVLGASGSGDVNNRMDVFDAQKLSKGGDIKLTFGYLPTAGRGGGAVSSASGFDGGVVPFCGVVNIPVVKYDPDYTGGEGEGGDLGIMISRVHYAMIQWMWQDDDLKTMGEDLVEAFMPGTSAGPDDRGTSYKPDASKMGKIIKKFQDQFDGLIKINFDAHRDSVDMSLDDQTKARGWGGAGIWYNKIAQVNGDVIGALNGMPTAASYPLILEKIVEQKREGDAGFSSCDMFRPNLADGTPVSFDNPTLDSRYARMMYQMQRSWACDTDKKMSFNILWDAMHMIFGIQGLFDMRCNNADNVHPLAQLTTIGKGLIDSSVRNMAIAMFTAAGGGALSALDGFGGDLSAMGQAASGFFVTMATIGLSLGFLLFYILPFMPFLYFFFAVGAWVKEVFEAMVGAPLWALAHIKIDGDGLPGKSAMNGYFLIFEIFVRPILIVVGLIGGMIIFSASVHLLNIIFDTAVLRLTGIDIDASSICTNDTGADAATVAKDVDKAGELDKHILDEFFFTVMYAIFVYMIAMSCFKMIDLVPNGILRFMGGGVTPFADEVQDPAENLGQYAAISGGAIGGKVIGGLKDMSAAGGQAIAGGMDLAGRLGGGKQGG